MPKVLIADKMSPRAEEIFKNRGVAVDVITGLVPDELMKIIDQYDGLAIRSSTKVTSQIINIASHLRVIGRAGIGVDNIDVATATLQGIVVMNTPFGNSITTAEHAIAMMFALAREIPLANQSTQAGKWEKNRFVGVELNHKILGVIGCGNIGSIVVDRAQGLKMKVIAFDPFLTPERAVDIGVDKVDLDVLLAQSDFITLHTPLTDNTRHIIDMTSLAKMKKGVRIINCARGGLIVEKDLKDFLDKEHVAGAALDVFENEPATENIFFGMDNVVCTPHLGASTVEAQVNVAVQVAEQISDYLLTGAVNNAINMPNISAVDAPRLMPHITLMEQLGLLMGQVIDSDIRKINIEYAGDVSDLNIVPLTSTAIAGILKPIMPQINMVNATVIAKNNGIDVSDTRRESMGIFESYIRLKITTKDKEWLVAGTVFSGGQARIIQLQNIDMEVKLLPFMLYIINNDQPGFIGALGTLLGQHNINIASFNLGRNKMGGNAIALVAVDSEVSASILANVQSLEPVIYVKMLSF